MFFGDFSSKNEQKRSKKASDAYDRVNEMVEMQLTRTPMQRRPRSI